MMIGLAALPLGAQLPCPRWPVVMNTPEDQLMLAVNHAENPQDQIAALNKFAQEHADSKFLPCVNEYLLMTYLKVQDYDKAIEAGEKNLAAQDTDLNLSVNLLKAYVGGGKVSDSAFALITDGPRMLRDEMTPTTIANAPAAEAEKARKAGEEQAKEVRQYLEYAFFQLLPRVPEAPKRLQFLDAFLKAYPDTPNMNQVNVQFFMAYKLSNDAAKINEYGEKAVSADPNNAGTLNLVADDYATRQINLEKAESYAKKALELSTSMKKPEGMTDEQFKPYRDAQLGIAHTTLGYLAMQKGSRTHRMAPAIEELKAAAGLLGGNPSLEGRALFYLGYAYEISYPANHHLAADALERAVSLQSPWQASARDLLQKVRKAGGH
jgi:hypothetical protein